jgi:ribosomal protein S18 acetylase RimI-like enzyme
MNDDHAFVRKNIKSLSTMLVDAFYEDPFYRYLFPEESVRPVKTSFFMEILLWYGISYGRVTTVNDSINGAAIWLPPSSPMIRTRGMIRMGMLKAPLILGLDGFIKLIKTTHAWEELQKKEQKQHWYLMAVGVDPDHQGKGLGSRVLQPVLNEADRGNHPCYLETMTVKNVDFYERHGFGIVTEARIDGKIPYWTMRRNPR